MTRAVFVYKDPQGRPLIRPLSGLPQMSEAFELRLNRAYMATRPRDYLTVSEVCLVTLLTRKIVTDACVGKCIRGAYRTVGANQGVYRILIVSYESWLHPTGRDLETVTALVCMAEEIVHERSA